MWKILTFLLNSIAVAIFNIENNRTLDLLSKILKQKFFFLY